MNKIQTGKCEMITLYILCVYDYRMIYRIRQNNEHVIKNINTSSWEVQSAWETARWKADKVQLYT